MELQSIHLLPKLKSVSDETGKEDTPLFREVQILNTVDEKERMDKVRAYEEKHGVDILQKFCYIVII